MVTSIGYPLAVNIYLEKSHRDDTYQVQKEKVNPDRDEIDFNSWKFGWKLKFHKRNRGL